MVMAAWQGTIVDGAGNVVPNAAIEVRRELPGLPPAACFSDKNGGGPLGSTFNAGVDGYVRFYAAGGFYRITATSGEFFREWQDVPIGTAAGTDAGVLPVAVPPTWLLDGATADADPGPGEFRLNNANHALATAAYLDNLSAGGVDVSAWLDTLDDTGDSALRGVLTILDPNNPATIFRTYAVSGSVVDGTGYRKLTLAPIAGAGSFTPGTSYEVTFAARGPAGAGGGDVTGPAGGVVNNEIPLYADATGKIIKGSGVLIASVVTGTPIKAVATQVFTASGTYTPNADMVFCRILVQAPGGGSGGADGAGASTQGTSSGAGGGGESAEGFFSKATIGENQAVTVGAVGTAGTAAGGNGGNGGNVSVGALISANGGSGGTGTGSDSGSSASRAGGAGGTGGSGGSVRIPGAPGEDSIGIGIQGANGGGSRLGYGRSGVRNSGVPANSAGRPGLNYGGGAAGATSSSNTGAAGAAGGNGIVIIEEFLAA